MKECINKILLGLLLVLPFYACKYEPVGFYDRAVDQNSDPPQIQVIELNFNEDTIILYRNKTIRFKFDTQYHNVVAVRLLVDTTEIGLFKGASGEITLNPWYFSEGIHNLELQVYTGSGTGSIADAIGLEGYGFSKKWKLKVYQWSGAEVNEFIENGILHVSWPEYDVVHYTEYYIFKTFMNNGIQVGRSKTSEYIDSAYAGESASYMIKGMDSEGNVITLGSTGVKSYIPIMNYSRDTLNTFSISWNKSIFYNAVDSYQVFLGYNYDQLQLVKSTHDLEDTAYDFKWDYFTNGAFVKLRVVPKPLNVNYNPEDYSAFETVIYIGINYSFPSTGNEIFPINDNEIIYNYSSARLLRFSLTSGKIINDFRLQNIDGNKFEMMSASPALTYITSRSEWLNGIIVLVNTNLNSQSEIDQHLITGDADYNEVPVSDAGTAIINIGDSSLTLYDLINLKALGHFIRSPVYPISAGKLKLSSSGDYFTIVDDSIRLFHIIDGNFKLVQIIAKPIGNMLIEFSPVNPEQFTFWNGSLLSVKRCDSFSTIHEFPLTENLEDIDYRNNNILTSTPGFLHIRSLEDGSLRKDIGTYYVPYSGLNSWFLINHAIVHRSGVYCFLN